MKIAIISTNRSDVGYLKPIQIEAQLRSHEVRWYDGPHFHPQLPSTFDWVICAFDRPEMAWVAKKIFEENGRIVQLAAGDTRIGGGDERHRWAISSYTSLLIPWTERAMRRCESFVRTTELPIKVERGWPTGWDHVTPEPYPCRDFDLVLLNPPCTDDDLHQVQRITRNQSTVWLAPNQYTPNLQGVHLTHAEFLGILQSCDRFITNSSSSWYIAPYVLSSHQIIRIGTRNRIGDAVVFRDDNEASRNTIEVMENLLCSSTTSFAKVTASC